jgi:hypothetical protein
MEKIDAAPRETFALHANIAIESRIPILQEGSRVRVTCYGPFQGLRGTIHTVNAIMGDAEEPFCFYQVALDGAWIKDPVWFSYDEVEDTSIHF